jgi:hypothetical protein
MAKNSIAVQLTKIQADSVQFKQAFTEMQKLVKDTKKVIDTEGKAMSKSLQGITKAASLIGVSFSAAAIVMGLKSIATEMVNIKNRATEVGVSSEGLQALDYAARQNNSSLEKLTEMLVKVKGKIGEALANPSSEAAKIFKQLKINVAEFNGVLDEEKLSYLMQSVKSSSNETTAFSLATKLMGEQSLKAGAALEYLARGYKQIEEDARKAGQVVSGVTIDAIDRAQKKIQEIKNRGTVAVGSSAGLFNWNPFADGTREDRQLVEDLLNSIGVKAPESLRRFNEAARESDKILKQIRQEGVAAAASFDAQIQATLSGIGTYDDKLIKLLNLAYVGQPTKEQTASALDAIQKLKEANKGLIDKLVEGAETAEEKWEKINQLLKDGVAAGNISQKTYQTLFNHYNPAVKTAAEETKKWADEQERVNKAVKDRAEAIKASVATPQEIHKQRQLELELAYSKGDIDSTTYERASTKNDADLAGSTGGAEQQQRLRELLGQAERQGNTDVASQLKVLASQTDNSADGVNKMTEALNGYEKQLGKTAEMQRRWAESIDTEIVGGIQDIIWNGKKGSEVIADFGQSLSKAFINQALNSAIQSLGSWLGGLGGGGGIFGTIGGALMQVGGGTSSIPKRAEGGLAEGLTIYGEKGPEIGYFGSQTRLFSNKDSKEMAKSLGGGRRGTTINFAPSYTTLDPAGMKMLFEREKPQMFRELINLQNVARKRGYAP